MFEFRQFGFLSLEGLSILVFLFVLRRPIMRLVKVFRKRELQGTLRITNEFNDCVQNQIICFEEWCNFIFMEYDRRIS